MIAGFYPGQNVDQTETGRSYAMSTLPEKFSPKGVQEFIIFTQHSTTSNVLVTSSPTIRLVNWCSYFHFSPAKVMSSLKLFFFLSGRIGEILLNML